MLHLIFTNISGIGVGFLGQKLHLYVKMFGTEEFSALFSYRVCTYKEENMLKGVTVHWKVKIPMKVKKKNEYNFYCYFIKIKFLLKLKKHWKKNMCATSISFPGAQKIAVSAVIRPGSKFNIFWIRLVFLCWTENFISSLVMSLRITLSHSLIKQGFLKMKICPRFNVYLLSKLHPVNCLVPIPSHYFRLFGIPFQISLNVSPYKRST